MSTLSTTPTCFLPMFLQWDADTDATMASSKSRAVSILFVNFAENVSSPMTNCILTCAKDMKSVLFANGTAFRIFSMLGLCFIAHILIGCGC